MNEHHKKIKKDGAIYHLLRDIATKEYRIHNWDGPAIEPINKEQKKKEYYLNGIIYDFDMWKEIKKSGEGLPWYKQSGNTVKTSRF